MKRLKGLSLQLTFMSCLLGIVGLVALADGAENAGAERIRVTPKESDRYLINPGKGWIIYSSFEHASDAAWEKASVGYARFQWRDIHTGDNQFNWESIDRMLKECVRRGKRFAFGIMPVCLNTKDNWVGMPDWLVKAGAKWYPAKDVPEVKVPVWDDPLFMARMNQFVLALAKRYNGHPNIEFIDCRTFGNWGEWHLGSLGGRDPGDAVKRAYLDQWAVFDKTWIIVPISDSSGMRHDQGYGWYARATGGFGAREDSSEHPPRWKTCLPFLDHGPAIGEWSFPYARIKNGEGWTKEKWRDEMLAGQIMGSAYSYQPLGEWNSARRSDADLFLSEKASLIAEWQNKMGYWFRMTEASYPATSAQGIRGEISFTIRNDGVAPIYLKSHTGVVKAAILDAQNRPLAVATLKEINPFRWKPGQKVVNTAEVSFPPHHRAARIAIGVFSREGLEQPDIQLGIENGTPQNWYVLSDMPKLPPDVRR